MRDIDIGFVVCLSVQCWLKRYCIETFVHIVKVFHIILVFSVLLTSFGLNEN